MLCMSSRDVAQAASAKWMFDHTFGQQGIFTLECQVLTRIGVI